MSDASEGEVKLRRFLEEIGAFRRNHRTASCKVDTGCSWFGRRTSEVEKVSLGTHLMGTYALLAAQGADQHICLAGGLHSVYGTNVYLSITIPPTQENRNRLIGLFGAEAEQLAHWFHVCDRPQGLEAGHPAQRIFGPDGQTELLDLSPSSLRALRLVEAANLLDQYPGSMAVRLLRLHRTYPNIHQVWATQCHWHALKVAMTVVKPAKDKGVLRLSVMLLSTSEEVEINVPMSRKRVDLQHLIASMTRLCPSGGECVWVWALRGELVTGMPWAPLTCLHSLAVTACAQKGSSRLAIVMRPLAMPVQHPIGDAVPMDSIPYSAFCTSSGVQLTAWLASLAHYGYAYVDTDASTEEVFQQAYAAMRHLATLRTAASDGTGSEVHRFDGGRYIGFAKDAARVWVQLREVFTPEGVQRWGRYADYCERYRNRDPGTYPTPSATSEEQRCIEALLCSTLLLQEMSRAIVTALLTASGTTVEYAHKLLKDPGSGSGTGPGYGSSVHRVYEYRNTSSAEGHMGSGLHADMGLLTLAPLSTRPALCLLQPHDLQAVYPEAGQSHKIIVFVGELLSYLTHGTYPAALHSVPIVQANEEPRLSMPFFLRPHKDTLLTPIGQEDGMTAAEYWEKHALALRPWRLNSTQADY